MTAPAPPKATQGQGELKRALLDDIISPWCQGIAGSNEDLLNAILARLAAGSPEVIEAMARAIREAFPHMQVGRVEKPTWEKMLQCDRDTWLRQARAALAAGMLVLRSPKGEAGKVIANG